MTTPLRKRGSLGVDSAHAREPFAATRWLCDGCARRVCAAPHGVARSAMPLVPGGRAVWAYRRFRHLPHRATVVAPAPERRQLRAQMLKFLPQYLRDIAFKLRRQFGRRHAWITFDKHMDVIRMTSRVCNITLSPLALRVSSAAGVLLQRLSVLTSGTLGRKRDDM